MAIHAALDARGRVLTYGTDGEGVQTGRFIYDVWSPDGTATDGHTTLPNTTSTDLFCGLQLNRPDTGDMVLFGGDNWNGASTTNTGNPDINQYDPDTGRLTPLPGMQRSRWYGSGTTLPDGSIYVQGGQEGADHPELWRPDTGSQLLDLDTSGLSWWYPRNFVLPDGRLFGVDADGRMYYISADLQTLVPAGRLGPDRWGYGVAAVMFAPGRILHFGGPTGTAVIIDANGTVPAVTPTASLSTARDWANGTLLPDGRVLATGGASNYGPAAAAPAAPLSAYGVVNTTEIWDPATGAWTVGSSGAVARLYHSTALLLPDGRVLVAGGGAPGPVTNTDAELYLPDYLTTATGQPTRRPVITALSSDDLDPGAPLTIEVDSDVAVDRVTLLKTGSVTHSVNMEQRITDLSFSADGSTLSTRVPLNAAHVTPGYYLLTVLTTEGVPSTSTLVRIGPGSAVPGLVGSPDPELEGGLTRLYRAYFLRSPDAAGLGYWVAQLRSGVALTTVSDVFAASAEFTASYGPLDDGAFVRRVYANVLGRPSDAGGEAYWTGQLASGVTRGEVMLAFSESAEFRALTGTGPAPGPADRPTPPSPTVIEAHRPEVYRLYRAYFRRDPELDGLAYWTSQRAAGIGLVAVADVFATSQEYVATYGSTDDDAFVELVYRNVLGRDPDAEGGAYWRAQLASGVTRGAVMTAFSESTEFVAIVGSGGG